MQKAKEKKQNQTPLIVPKRTIPAEADNCAAPPKRLRKTCSHEGCTNQVRSGGVCYRHGAKRKECTHEGCTNQVVRGGVCVRHGAKLKECNHEGCTMWSTIWPHVDPYLRTQTVRKSGETSEEKSRQGQISWRTLYNKLMKDGRNWLPSKNVRSCEISGSIAIFNHKLQLSN